MRNIKIGEKLVGHEHPCFIVAEIGLNHNGDVELAKQLINLAVNAKCDAVKFQKRTPELCVPEQQKNLMRETPWGTMTYMEYRKRMEFGKKEYQEIDKYCKERGIMWFASCWDVPSLDFISQFDPPCYKIASPCLTDRDLLISTKKRGKPIIMSTGFSTLSQIKHAVDLLGRENIAILHCIGTYPANNEELNLAVINSLKTEFPDIPIGYSGHERGISPSLAAVALGACIIERHITTDRTLWGSDQAASLGPTGINLLVRDIRIFESALGDGVKRVLPSEIPAMNRLRRKTDF